MDRRVALTIAVALVTILAGCSWVERPTNTPVSTPDDSGEGHSIPVGRLNAHANALESESYELRIEITARTPNRSQNGTVHVVSDRDAERMVIRTHSGNGSLYRYVANGTVFSRITANGTTQYGTASLEARNLTFGTLHRNGLRLRRLRTLFEFGDYEPGGNVTRDGRRYERLNLTTAANGPNASVQLDHSSGEILIDPDGVVHDATIDLRGTQQGDSFVYAVDYRLTPEDVSIQPPEWLDEARASGNATAATSTRTRTDQTTRSSG